MLESRQDDSDDIATISRHRAREPRLVYRHLAGLDEPLLWLADGIAWAVSAGVPVRNTTHRHLTT